MIRVYGINKWYRKEDSQDFYFFPLLSRWKKNETFSMELED